MAYQFHIEVPRAERIRPRRGEYPGPALERLARIEAALLRADPSLKLDRDEGLLHGEGDRLGAVMADPNRVTLQTRSGSGFGAFLNGVHDALGVLEPLGLAGYDPQVGGPIRYSADGPTFLRQFRSQVLCPDHEFEQWIHGIEPDSWRRRRELQPRFEAGFRLENFPPLAGLVDESADSSEQALVTSLRRVAAYNDAILDRLGLRDAMALFKDINGRPRRRSDGSWVPWSTWFCRSSLEQEVALLSRLQRLGWKGAIFDQPQWLQIRYGSAETPASAESLAASEPIVRALSKAAKAHGPLEHVVSGSDDAQRSIEFETPDARALLDALRPQVLHAAGLRPQITIRRGGPGTPIEVLEAP